MKNNKNLTHRSFSNDNHHHSCTELPEKETDDYAFGRKNAKTLD
jgi:hypothetical protein